MPSIARRLARRLLPVRARRTVVRIQSRVQASEPPPTVSATDRPRDGRPSRRTRSGSETKGAQDTTATIPVLDTLRRGGRLPEALVAQVRAQMSQGDLALASSISASLRRAQETEQLGTMLEGLIAARRGYEELAWSLLGSLPEQVWVIHAAEEYVRAGLAQDPEAVTERVRALVARPPAYVGAESWLAMLGPIFGHGDMKLAGALFELLDDAIGDGGGCEADLVVNRDWLRHWVSTSPDARSADPVPDGTVSFAVMDYGHPGRARASANVGDHVQSLAALGHLVRHQRLAYSGPQDLVDLVHQLRGRVRPERQTDEIESAVRLLQVDRDASSYSEIPPGTWTLGFGWFMHPIFGMRYDFPLHRNLLPIFVSFHCSKRDLLTDEAIEYLKGFAPIGCRDWTTVDVLLSVDVPAFFSGCMTSTVSTLFPDTLEGPGPDGRVAYVDVEASAVPPDAPTYRHSDDAIRFRSFCANTYDAVSLLETYRRKHPGLVTSRLHCYLPGRSIGVPVDFQPGNRSDPRFAGLIDITDAEFDRMRNDLDAKLEQVFAAILSGRSSDEVYDMWRRLNAVDVEAARQRRARPAAMPPARTDLAAEIAKVRTSLPPGGAPADAVHIVVFVPRGRQHAVEVLLSTVVQHSSRPVHAWLLARKTGFLDVRQVQERVPGVTVTAVEVAALQTDLRMADGSVPPARDIGMLSLPLLLRDVQRVAVVPADAVVLADVSELVDMDLGGRLFAAPAVAGRPRASGFGALHAAAGRLGPRTAASAELRRQAHARHRFDFDAFDDDVLVLDLDAMRRHRLVETYVPYVEAFSLRYRETLLFESGPQRAKVPERWHVVPGRSLSTDPALLHWADREKPWSAGVVQDQEVWLAAAARLGAAGCGMLPPLSG